MVNRTVNVTSPTPNDILLGRGAFTINNQGNIRFRSLVRDYQDIYVSTSRRRRKAIIANQVLAAVKEQDGRFLRRIETEAEVRAAGLSPGVVAWVEADECTVMQKIKQALRETVPDSDADSTKPSPLLTKRASASSVSSKIQSTKRSKTCNAAVQAPGFQHTVPEAKNLALSQPRVVNPQQHHYDEPGLNFTQFQNLAPAKPEPFLQGYSDMSRLQFVPPQEQLRSNRNQFPIAMLSPVSGPRLLQALAAQQLSTQEESRILISQLERERQVTLQRLRQQDEALARLRRAFLGNSPAAGAST